MPSHGIPAHVGEHLGEQMAVHRPFTVLFPHAYRQTVQERGLRPR